MTGKVTEVVVGNSFPGELTGEECRRLGITLELSEEAKREIELLLAQCYYLRRPGAAKQ